jgi:hypothetical protein
LISSDSPTTAAPSSAPSGYGNASITCTTSS